MNKNNYFIKSIKNDIKQIEMFLKRKKIYIMKKNIMISLLKSGISISYALPFILSLVILNQAEQILDINPIIFEYKVIPRIGTTIPTTGVNVIELNEYINFAIVLFSGIGINIFEDKVIKDKNIKNRLRKLERFYQSTKNEMNENELEKILLIKKNNLELFDENQKVYNTRLIRKR